MATQIWVNIRSVNGLLPDGTKPSPEPMLTYHQWSAVAFILGQFHKRCLNHQLLKICLKLTYLKFHSNFPGATELLWFISSSGLAYHTQDLLLYYPDQPSHSRLYVESPAAAGLPYENIYERAEDGVRINMYLVLQPASTRPNAHTVIYFHGNAGNIGHRYMMQGSQYG